MEKYNNAKMVAMAENDCFSTVENLTTEKAGWLYFCTWYDGGSENNNFLTNPLFNTLEDTIEMYQSDYCITLDELPADLYSNEIKPVQTTTTTSDPSVTTTTTTTTTSEFVFKQKSYKVDLPEERTTLTLEIEGAPTASVGGGVGYGTTADDWVNIEWSTSLDSDGKRLLILIFLIFPLLLNRSKFRSGGQTCGMPLLKILMIKIVTSSKHPLVLPYPMMM